MALLKRLWDLSKWVQNSETCKINISVLNTVKMKPHPWPTKILGWDPFMVALGHIKYAEHNGTIQKIMGPV